jgi:two-component system, sensor histidine kinase
VICSCPRTDGFTFVERLRGDPRWRATPVVAVTGLGYDSDYQRTWEAGFDGHLVKPIDIEMVIEALRRYLPSKARRAPSSGLRRASGRRPGRGRK